MTLLCDNINCSYQKSGFCCKPFVMVINGALGCLSGKDFNTPEPIELNLVEGLSVPVEEWVAPEEATPDCNEFEGLSLSELAYEC